MLRVLELREHQRLFLAGTTETGGGVGESGARLLSLHHVQLAMPPGEEEAAVRFYGAILGLERVPKPEQLSQRGGVWFRSGELDVHLGVEETFRPAQKAHPAFLVHDLDTLVERIETAGYRVRHDVGFEGYRRVHVRDPFGNRLELIEPES